MHPRFAWASGFLLGVPPAFTRSIYEEGVGVGSGEMKSSGVNVGDGRGEMNWSRVGVTDGVCEGRGETKLSDVGDGGGVGGGNCGVAEGVWVGIRPPPPAGVGVCCGAAVGVRVYNRQPPCVGVGVGKWCGVIVGTSEGVAIGVAVGRGGGGLLVGRGVLLGAEVGPLVSVGKGTGDDKVDCAGVGGGVGTAVVTGE